MGDVYSAYDKDLREPIRRDLAGGAPNVCKVYDLSQEKRSSNRRVGD